MAETLSKDSKVVIFDSTVNLTDANVNSVKQGVAVENIGKFTPIDTGLSNVTRIDARAQALKYGESFVQSGNPNGGKLFICTGEYGKTLIKNIEFVAGDSTVAYSGTGGSSATNKLLQGGSYINPSDIARVDVVIDGVANSVTSVTVDRRGTNYKAGDVLTILGTDLGGATPADDITITLHQNDLNNAEIISLTLSDIASGL